MSTSSSSSSSSSSHIAPAANPTATASDAAKYIVVGPPAFVCIGGTGNGTQNIKPVPTRDDSGSRSGLDQKSNSLVSHIFSFNPNGKNITLKVQNMQSSELMACRADINTFLLKYGIGCEKELLKRMKKITDSIFKRELTINIDLNISVVRDGLTGAKLSRYTADVNTYINAWTTRLKIVCDIYYSISDTEKNSIDCLGYKIRNLLAPNQKIMNALRNKYNVT